MSDNSWYENGELPPVDCECMRENNKVVIVAHMKACGNKYAAYQQLDGLGCGYAGVGAFTTIKTERELAIEAAEKVMSLNDIASYKHIAEKLFDAGLLRSKNES